MKNALNCMKLICRESPDAGLAEGCLVESAKHTFSENDPRKETVVPYERTSFLWCSGENSCLLEVSVTLRMSKELNLLQKIREWHNILTKASKIYFITGYHVDILSSWYKCHPEEKTSTMCIMHPLSINASWSWLSVCWSEKKIFLYFLYFLLPSHQSPLNIHSHTVHLDLFLVGVPRISLSILCLSQVWSFLIFIVLVATGT